MSAENGRVLIVEDEVGVARMIYRWLDEAGIPSDLAETKDEAKEKVKSTRYSAVLLDGNLNPGSVNGKDGEEIAEFIEESSLNADAYIINTSGSDENPRSDLRLTKKEIAADPAVLVEKIAQINQGLLQKRNHT